MASERRVQAGMDQFREPSMVSPQDNALTQGMILTHDGKAPRIDPTCRIAPNAVICGDVTIGPHCSIGFGCVLTAENGPIEISANCVVMDLAIIRGVRNGPVTIGQHVLVGPRACISGATIEDEVFLAAGTTVFNGATIGRNAQVRINGIVHIRTRLAAGAVVPIGWIAVGDPAQLFSPDQHEAIWEIQKTLDFPGFVFGLERPADGGSIMPELTRRYARSLSMHRQDQPVAAPVPPRSTA